MHDVKRLIEKVGVEAWLSGHLQAKRKEPKGWFFSCPFHGTDSNPSFFIAERDLRFHCFGCKRSGDLVGLVADLTHRPYADALKALFAAAGEEMQQRRDGEKKTSAAPAKPQLDPIPNDVIMAEHEALMKSTTMLQLIEEKRGWSIETIRHFLLGLRGDRITIPIPDEKGAWVNTRMYKIGAGTNKMIGRESGRNEARLFPEWAFKHTGLLSILEGETDLITAWQRGIIGVTSTSGAGSWKEDWNQRFIGRDVIICYDIDEPGVKGAYGVAARLKPHTKSVKVLRLPLNITEHPHGDLSDYFVKMGYSAQDYWNLVDETSNWGEAEKPIDADKVYETTLFSASLAQYDGKRVKVGVVPSAKRRGEYIIPKRVRIECDASKQVCASCPAKPEASWKEFDIAPDNPALLKMFSVGERAQNAAVNEAIGVPEKCPGNDVYRIAAYNIEDLQLVPQLRIVEERDHTVRRAFSLTHGIETNVPYVVIAKTIPHPKDQIATHLIYEAIPSVDSVSQFDPATGCAGLDAFQPREWTAEALRDRLKALYADLSANVTRIYNRIETHLIFDLIYHSATFFRFQGVKVNAWCEGLIIGDSGQGKSETAKHLLDFYGRGEKVDCKVATRAGLLGGLQEIGGEWWVSWGTVPLNDRGFVLLEEIKGMDPQVIAALTEMRSSGEATIAGIEKRKTFARTRLLWISNPRSNRKLATYTYGVEAVRELIGNPEDVRRFTTAIGVFSGDVDPDVYNMASSKRPTVTPVYTKDMCRRLVAWGWSRNSDDVEISDETEQAILDAARNMAGRYSATIPLVENADQRLKIARLATALAIRTFSASDDKKAVIVRPCHVEVVAGLLLEWYRRLGYEQFSADETKASTISDADQVEAILKSMPHNVDVMRCILTNTYITNGDLSDWMGGAREAAREIMGLLMRKQALKKTARGAVKTPSLIAMLQRLVNGAAQPTLTAPQLPLKHKTPTQIEDGDEF